MKKLNKVQKKSNPRNTHRGGGQSLGGSRPGEVFHIVLSNPGPLGVEVEKTSNGRGSAIIALAVPGTQAETAGLLRGDIVCHPNSDGEEEIMYKQFIAMAKSKNRPLVFDVRRISTKKSPTGVASSSSAAPAKKGFFAKKGPSAESEGRRQAVIAAAEARDKAHKKKVRPVPKTGHLTTAEKQRIAEQRQENENYNAQHIMKDKPLAEETKKAVEAAKADEMSHAAVLGYNPYEQANVSAGQAKTASIAVAHGTVNAGEAIENKAPPKATAQRQHESDTIEPTSIEPTFDDAFTLLVTTNLDPKQTSHSLGIMRKLIINATTKGQQGEEELSSKYRKVRLSNPKIKAAITDMGGAIEVMMATGFELHELDEETCLVYPPCNNGPSWIPKALRRMEQYNT